MQTNITSTKIYVPAVTLFINDDIKSLENTKQEYKRTISWNKYRSKITAQPKNNNLYCMIDLTFKNIKRFFVLSHNYMSLQSFHQGNQRLLKIFIKGFERSVYRVEYKIKSETQNKRNEYRYFFKSKFAGDNKTFVLIYTNGDTNAKRYSGKKYYFSKSIIDNYNVIIK